MAISKLACTGLLMLAISGVSSLAQATSTNLIIHNNTDSYSTAWINGFACSNLIGEGGITKPKSTNVIESSLLGVVCGSNPHACSADVYLTKNCTGPKIASATLDTSTGVVPGSIKILDTSYGIIAAGFEVTLFKNPGLL